MRVTQGWSGEVEPNRWAKFSVSCDEEDLFRLVADADVFPGQELSMVEQFVRHLPTTVVYQLLSGEAERYVLSKLTTEYGMAREQATARIARIMSIREDLFNKIRTAAEEPVPA